MARVLVKDVFNIVTVGIVIVGEVQSGTLKTGMKAQANGYEVQVAKMEADRQVLQEASAGKTLGFGLANISVADNQKYVEAMKSLKGSVLEFQ